MKSVSGLFTALITPFHSDGTVNEEALRLLINFQIEAGVDGLVLLGTTGESPTLTHEEKKNITRIAREEINHRVHFMVGTGSYSTRQTIENNNIAQDLGADSVLIVTPYYNKPTQEGIFLHFKAIAQAIKIPFMVYNIEGRTGKNIETATLKKISELPYVSGVKESSGRLNQLMDVIENISLNNPKFSVMSGDDAYTLPGLLMGGDGIISVVGNLIPLQMKELIQLADNDRKAAIQLHYQLSPFFREAFIETNPIPIKAAMNFCGLNAGGCRLPLSPLKAENEEILFQCLRSSPFFEHIEKNLRLYRQIQTQLCSPIAMQRP